MKRSSTGWPIDFTDNQLKILYVLADDKGHSAKEIAERMVDREKYQVVYSKSLSDVDNVITELGKLSEEKVVYIESRNELSEKANREYSVAYYRINPLYYVIIRDIAKKLKEEAKGKIFKAFEKGLKNKRYSTGSIFSVSKIESDRYSDQEGLYHYVQQMFDSMINCNPFFEEIYQVSWEGKYSEWSPARGEMERLAARVRSYYMSSYQKITDNRATSLCVVCELRPDLLAAHREWLKKNSLNSSSSSESKG
jgi:hypothetical protein